MTVTKNIPKVYTTIQKISERVLKEIDHFIQQGCNKLIKTDCKDSYNVTKYLYLHYYNAYLNAVILNFYSSTNSGKKITVSTKKRQHNYFQHW